MRIWLLFTAVFVCLTVLPATSLAVRLVDRNYELSRLEADGCIVEEDYDRLGIYPNKSSAKGFQANFHSEHALLELLTKFYGCEILKAGGEEAYFISFNNRKEDGSIRTITSSLNLEREDAIRMPSKMNLYPNMESIKAIDGYAGVLNSYGEQNVFFQGINIEAFKYIGLFDTEGKLISDADGQLVK